MSKILPTSFLCCLTSLQRQFFSTQIVSGTNKAPKYNEELPTKKCHPKNDACRTALCACGLRRYPKCVEPHVPPRLALHCCCNRNLTKNPCEESPRKKPKHKEKEPFKSMWEVCGAKKYCPLENERYDDKHYEPSDRNKREYTQTWKTCEPLVLQRKVCCINEMCMVPPVNKRRKAERPETAKEKDSELLKCGYNLMRKSLQMPENPKMKFKKCKKIVMPGCRNVASRLLCVRHRRPSHCSRECCPYPSFSECQHESTQPEHNVECRCLRPLSLCEITRLNVGKTLFKIEPPLPEWPSRDRLK